MENNSDLEYRVFTQKSEYDKAINTLKGILEGINIDGKINSQEIEELDKWAENHYKLIKINPFSEFIHTIRVSIRDEDIPIEETIENLYWLCQKYDQENIYFNALTADLQTLQGICHGIISDGVINDKEVFGLEKWLENNRHLSTYYPYDELRTVIQNILKDGVVDEEEKILLKAYFNQFVKLTNEELTRKISDEIQDTNISGLCTYEPDISFEGNLFCITGKLSRESRKNTSKMIEDLGGTFKNRVSKDTKFLIVGNDGSPAWTFACYGRKVEQAIKMRKEGANITLVHELDFWDYVDEISDYD